MKYNVISFWNDYSKLIHIAITSHTFFFVVEHFKCPLRNFQVKRTLLTMIVARLISSV
jgi:hypothetical protein